MCSIIIFLISRAPFGTWQIVSDGAQTAGRVNRLCMHVASVHSPLRCTCDQCENNTVKKYE